MKRIHHICLIFVTVFYSCSKDSNPTPTSPPVLVNSYKFYSAVNNSLSSDTMSFDANNNIVTLSYQFISNLGPTQTIDSGSFHFVMNPNGDLPVSYTLSGRKYFDPEDVTEEHSLFYDDQKRVILDSMVSISSAGNETKGAHFIYSDNVVVVNTFRQPDNDYTQKDSMVSTNQNFSYYSDYYNNAGSWNFEYSYTMHINDGFDNPLYDAGLSKSLGAFLLYNTFNDFLSKNLTSPEGFNFTWTKDTEGRVTQGSAPDGSYIRYSYK